MTAGEAAEGWSPKPWLPWLFLGLLVLPFHPYWVDFEQVRRGLLLVLAGGCLVALPRLLPVRGERATLAFFGFLVACAVIDALADAWLRDAKQMPSFQPWEAIYRLAHWLALFVVLRLGAAARAASATPFALLLLLTSLFGLLQRLGVAEIAGYGVEREPVSVFGNLNVAAEWTAVAAMVVAVALPRTSGRARGLAFAALLLAGAYAVANQSRSALVALPVGLAVLAALRRERLPLPLLTVLLGAALGFLLHTTAVRPDQAPLAELQRGTSTLAVRLEIAKGATKLFAESPVFGRGPGQFAVQYPRFRSQGEIEASSHGRQFPTEVRTAHDDWLELLVDGGLPALGLFAAMLFVLQRGQRDKSAQLPLFVLLLLMLVRAPLWNAPAAVAAVWLVGAPVASATPATAWRRWLAIAAGLALVGLGLLPIVANTRFAACVQANRNEQPPQREDAAAAVWWMPFEPRWQQFLAQLDLASGDLANAKTHAAAAVALRPFDPQAYELLVEILVRGKAFDAASQLIDHALPFDPAHPELRTWHSWLCMQNGDAEGAILAVVDNPHPTLRGKLAEHFEALGNATADPVAKARFAVEYHFLAALDGLGKPEPAAQVATTQHISAMGNARKEAGLPRDQRVLVVGALQMLELGQIERAIKVGERSATWQPLLPWQRALFGDRLERLRSLETWQAFLDKR